MLSGTDRNERAIRDQERRVGNWEIGKLVHVVVPLEFELVDVLRDRVDEDRVAVLPGKTSGTLVLLGLTSAPFGSVGRKAFSEDRFTIRPQFFCDARSMNFQEQGNAPCKFTEMTRDRDSPPVGISPKPREAGTRRPVVGGHDQPEGRRPRRPCCGREDAGGDIPPWIALTRGSGKPFRDCRFGAALIVSPDGHARIF